MHNRIINAVKALAGLAVVATLLGACTSSGGGGDSTKTEQKVQKGSYDALVKGQPAHAMSYSPTRNTANFWIDTWGKNPNKLAYVYLQNANGDFTGYYVFKGLPVSYCVALTPNYKLVDPGGSSDNGNIVVPAPSVDGVYYSGGQCNTYYGRDATTNAYIEYTAGLGINVLLYDQPLPGHPNVPQLGFTKIK